MSNDEEARFTIMPVDVLIDHRLTLIETRVLGAILSYRSKTTNVSWPSREAISRRCGYAIGTVTNATTSLVKKGWLKKSKKSFNGPNEYEITTPTNLTDPVRLTESVNLTDPVSTNLTDPVSTFLTDPVSLRYQEETIRRDQCEQEAASRPLLTQKTKNHPCPHQSILALYHEILPELSRHKTWDGTRAANLAKIWKSDINRQDLDYWKDLFEWIKESDFLMGRTSSWQATLEWIIKPANFAKVIDGQYHRKEQR